MASDSMLTNHERHIRKLLALEQSEHLAWQRSLWYLHAYVKSPDIVKRELAVIPSKNVQLPLHYIGGVSTSWSRSVVSCLHLLPIIGLDVEHMHIVHPVHAIVPAEVVYF